ncbi:MAG: hypothetical protein AB7V44_27905, partial [Pseudonocardia sp.]
VPWGAGVAGRAPPQAAPLISYMRIRQRTQMKSTQLAKAHRPANLRWHRRVDLRQNLLMLMDSTAREQTSVTNLRSTRVPARGTSPSQIFLAILRIPA